MKLNFFFTIKSILGILWEIIWAFKFLSEEHIFFLLTFWRDLFGLTDLKERNHSKDFSKNLRSIILTVSLLYPHDIKKKKKDEV